MNVSMNAQEVADNWSDFEDSDDSELDESEESEDEDEEEEEDSRDGVGWKEVTGKIIQYAVCSFKHTN